MVELRSLSAPIKPGIIAIVETWLDSDILESEVAISGYRMFRRDRSRHGGGLLMYINESQHVKSQYYTAELELMGVAVSNLSGSLLVGPYYQPPNSGTDLDELEQAMNIYSCSACALVGDFNIRSLTL